MMAELTALRLIVAAVLLVLSSAFLRLLYILPAINPRPPKARTATQSSHILIVLGSGGHTAEMISLIRDIDPGRHTFRTYVISAGDAFSATKAAEFEAILADKYHLPPPGTQISPTYRIYTVPRAREVHQSLWSAPISSLLCLWASFGLFSTKGWKGKGVDMIITNGPATGVIVVLAANVLTFFGMQDNGDMKSIYVESWARVKTLSLSGKILLWGGLTDRFFVQWEGLQGGRKEWKGFLVE